MGKRHLVERVGSLPTRTTMSEFFRNRLRKMELPIDWKEIGFTDGLKEEDANNMSVYFDMVVKFLIDDKLFEILLPIVRRVYSGISDHKLTPIIDIMDISNEAHLHYNRINEALHPLKIDSQAETCAIISTHYIIRYVDIIRDEALRSEYFRGIKHDLPKKFIREMNIDLVVPG